MKTDELPAGRELNTFIAEVMGWEVVSSSELDERYAGGKWTPCVSWVERRNGFVAFRTRESIIKEWVLWSPSTDIGDAWEVVEKMADKGFDVSVGSLWGKGHHRVAFTPSEGRGTGKFKGSAATAPHAICLAAYELHVKIHE